MRRIGLIAGHGRYPILFAQAARRKGVEVVCVAIEGETSREIEGLVDKVSWVHLWEFKRLIEVFQKERIRQAVMAGSVTKTEIYRKDVKLDQEAEKLITNTKDRKDKTLLKAAALRLRLAGVKLIDSRIFLEDLLPQKGVFTKRQPTESELQDVKFGRTIAKKLADLEIGQTIVVKNKTVVAVEAIEGTNDTISRAGKLGKGDIVVVKVSRPKQDVRFDIPTVGPDTINALADAGGGVLAIEAKKMFMIDKEETIRLADQKNIAVIAV
ncbi:MAG: UDP-2,3-diacylglucosamine diphosphatase LpxI [Candidatus Omnitrophica bacterium]|nr:UDP-2,3-diacylglucosamine diphosphatase LpxI [Candidatus Omnitrophota bacterium]